jgi:hypothetical protein
MLFGGVDKNDGADGFARVVSWFVKFDLDLSRVFVAHRFVINYDKNNIRLKNYIYQIFFSQYLYDNIRKGLLINRVKFTICRNKI